MELRLVCRDGSVIESDSSSWKCRVGSVELFMRFIPIVPSDTSD